MAEREWEITIYQAIGTPKHGKLFAVVTTVAGLEPSIELFDTLDSAETKKRQSHELLWRADKKMFD